MAAGCGNPDANTTVCGANTTKVGNECRGPETPEAGAPDTNVCSGPPTFDGVVSVSPVSPTALQVTWKPAKDDVTPADQIKYRVYAATTPSGQNLAVPQKETQPGANHVVINGLTPAGGTWYVVVRAVNGCGIEDTNSNEKQGISASDTTAPVFGGITGAAPSTEKGGAVKVSWDPATDSGTSADGMVYLVYRSTNPDALFTTTPTLTDPGVTSYTVTGLADSKVTYWFGVRARDAAGNIGANDTAKKSSTASADTGKPTFGGCTEVSQKDASSLILKWNPPTDDVAKLDELKIKVYAATETGKQIFTAPSVVLAADDPAPVLPGLMAKTTYYVVCRAVDPAGNEENNSVELFAATGEDKKAPVFDGIDKVVSIDSTTATVSWPAATDDQTSADKITYDVYYGDTPSTIDWTKSRSSVVGKLTTNVGSLTPGHAYVFAVRATDASHNQEMNTKTVPFETAYNFTSIQAIFTAHCAVSGCHVVGGAAPFPLIAGASYGQIVNVPSSEVTTILRVKPGDSANSYLYMKLKPLPGITGSPMPLAPADPVADSDKEIIRKWIDSGAPAK